MIEDPVAELLLRVAEGDRLAFRRLYSATSAKLYGVVLRMLKSEAEAKDALQVVYTRVWTRAGRYDPGKGRAMTWLISIARNYAIDCLRTGKTHRVIESEAFPVDFVRDDAPTMEARLIARDQLTRLHECFELLDPSRAAAVRKAYLDGYSYKELAEAYEVPLNTMRTWLRRSLLKLRECIES